MAKYGYYQRRRRKKKFIFWYSYVIDLHCVLCNVSCGKFRSTQGLSECVQLRGQIRPQLLLLICQTSNHNDHHWFVQMSNHCYLLLIYQISNHSYPCRFVYIKLPLPSLIFQTTLADLASITSLSPLLICQICNDYLICTINSSQSVSCSAPPPLFEGGNFNLISTHVYVWSGETHVWVLSVCCFGLTITYIRMCSQLWHMYMSPQRVNVAVVWSLHVNVTHLRVSSLCVTLAWPLHVRVWSTVTYVCVPPVCYFGFSGTCEHSSQLCNTPVCIHLYMLPFVFSFGWLLYVYTLCSVM